MNAEAGRAAPVPHSPFPIPHSLLVALCCMAECREILLRTREAGGEEAGDAILKFVTCDRVERLVRCVAEVESAAPVRMDIDKSRQQR